MEDQIKVDVAGDDDEEEEVEVNIEEESKKFLNLVRENKTEEALA
jgi:hypothetical protein